MAELCGFERLHDRVPLPEGVTIEVHEEKPDDKVVHLVILPKPGLSELADEELDAVAGGVADCVWGDCRDEGCRGDGTSPA